TRFDAPTQITNAGDGTNRLFIVERRGTVRVLKGGALQSGYFLDIRSLVGDGGERGLLGLAFHPKFETNRRLFVYYTRSGGDIVVARLTANKSGTRVSSSTARPLLLIEHSAASNHNGGSLVFGPNGYLYIGVGDGGGGGDPERDAQSKTRNFLGKILRINVDGTGSGPFDRYAVPRSNPFSGSTPGLGEIWAYGLRNPWRTSFDRETGRFYIADVGQDLREEIDREPSGFAGGRNYGWNAMEGTTCYDASQCPKVGDVLPAAEYAHVGGNCSITGGYVYRGSAYPKLDGQYVFADFCSGRIWTLPQGGLTADLVQRADTGELISSFGESEGGELYAVTIDGKVFRITAS
ncbi:MAG: PQQ-dependent sugar dehydrogenase, partial [Candidatus Limnocylindrales bacterium]